MFVFGVVRMLTPYSAAAKVGGYSADCGSAIAPKHVVTTINCNHGAHLALDLSLLLSGIVLAAGSAAVFVPQTSDAGTDRSGTYG